MVVEWTDSQVVEWTDSRVALLFYLKVIELLQMLKACSTSRF